MGMGLADKIIGFLKREAKDVGDMAEKARDKLDAELTKRETDLKKTPSERIEDLQGKASETDAEFDRILDKADAQAAEVTADAEVATAADVSGKADLADAIATENADDADAVTEAGESVTDAADAAVDALDPVEAAEKAGDPKYGKTPAQIKYEQARDNADRLLEELRGELKADGEA